MKLNILMHYDVDEKTGEVTFIGKEEVSIDTGKKVSKTNSQLEDPNPRLQLNANNFALNEAACNALNVSAGDTIYITYPKKGDNYVPAIGASKAFGVETGNKLTKSLTVSFRGLANATLKDYGSNFELEESDRPGVFYLKGDKVLEKTEASAIEIDDDLEPEDFEDFDLDLEESTDISSIDLTL